MLNVLFVPPDKLVCYEPDTNLNIVRICALGRCGKPKPLLKMVAWYDRDNGTGTGCIRTFCSHAHALEAMPTGDLPRA